MTGRIPSWIRYKIPGGKVYTGVKKVIETNGLHTICLEAGCPNIGECFSCGTATFLILGDTCTRNCRYCAVKKGIPTDPDMDEPLKIADAVAKLKLKYCVITSVTRDDMADGGAELFAMTTSGIRKSSPSCGIELLVPDFKDSQEEALNILNQSPPDVLNHNIEVVKSLYRQLRPAGDYIASLKLLKLASEKGMKTKSGLMIGFGETMKDIELTLKDLRESECKILTVGQYLKSHKDNFDVVKYYHPDEFKEIEKYALTIGFESVLSGPLVRSSYHAEEVSGT